MGCTTFPITTGHPDYLELMNILNDEYVMTMTSHKWGGYALNTIAGKVVVVRVDDKELERKIRRNKWKMEPIFNIDKATLAMIELDILPFCCLELSVSPCIPRMTRSDLEYYANNIKMVEDNTPMPPVIGWFDFEQVSQYRGMFQDKFSICNPVIQCSFNRHHGESVSMTILTMGDPNDIDDLTPSTSLPLVIPSELVGCGQYIRSDGTHIVIVPYNGEKFFWYMFILLVRCLDIDIMAAWNNTGYDNKRIIDRAATLLSGCEYGLDDKARPPLIGLQRYIMFPEDVHGEYVMRKGLGDEESFGISCDGLVFIDGMLICKSLLVGQGSFSLNAISAFAGVGAKGDVSYMEISDAYYSMWSTHLQDVERIQLCANHVNIPDSIRDYMIEEGLLTTRSLNLLEPAEGRQLWNRLIEYNKHDTELPYLIFKKLHLWETFFAYCNVAHAPLRVAAVSGQSALASSMLAYAAYHEQISYGRPAYKKKVITTISAKGIVKKEDEKYAGGLVLDPITGLHRNVVDPDANSLYPSTIIAANIDHATTVPPYLDHTKVPHKTYYMRNPRTLLMKPRTPNDLLVDGTNDPVGSIVVPITQCIDRLTLKNGTGAITIQLWPIVRVTISQSDYYYNNHLCEGDTNVPDWTLPGNMLEVLMRMVPEYDSIVYPNYPDDVFKHKAHLVTYNPVKYITYAAIIDEDKKVLMEFKLEGTSSLSEGITHVDVSISEEITEVHIMTGVIGLMPKVCSKLLTERSRVKQLMASAATPADKELHNCNQLAIKTVANSVYGFTGSNAGYDPLIAPMVTFMARNLIGNVHRWVLSTSEIPFHEKPMKRIVYGDTDSIMLKLMADVSLEELQTSADRIIECLNKLMETITGGTIIKFGLDGIFYRVFYICPKNYAYIALKDYANMAKAGDPSAIDYPLNISQKYIHMKGISMVRSDQTEWGKRLIVNVFRMILFEAPRDRIMTYIEQECNVMRKRNVPLADCCLTNVLRSSSKKNIVYDISLQLRRIGKQIDHGDSITWFHVIGGKGGTIDTHTIADLDVEKTIERALVDIHKALPYYYL